LLVVMFVTVSAMLPELVTLSVCEVELPTLTVPNDSEDCGREITAEPLVVKLTITPLCVPAVFCPAAR